MKREIKKMIRMLATFTLVATFTIPVFAHTGASNENVPENITEKTVEVNTYIDFLNYPKEPQYKYTFVIKTPPIAQPRNSACYKCGKLGLTINNYRTFETNRKPKGCPYNPNIMDHFTTWGNTYDLSCGYCGYRDTIKTDDTYTSYCLNSEGHDFERTFEVRRNWTLSGGREIHECWSTWH